jgi:hypothetical protein
VDKNTRTVKIYTELSLKHLKETTPHWGIGYAGGSCRDKFIFVSPVEPAALYDALASINARPGNNLTMDTNGSFTLGDEIKVSAWWQGLKYPLDMKDFFYDSSQKGFKIRFSGNLPAAQKYKTGCLTCLESCPVAITSNAVYPQISSITRSIKPNSHFKGKPQVIPGRDALPVVVSYKVV